MCDELRIVCDPDVLCGKPVIAGTRISVELVLDHLGHGDSVDDLLADYPHLSREQVRAAILFASDAMRRPLPTKAEFLARLDVPK